MTTLSRLDDRNIEDPVLRSYMRRVVKQMCDSYDPNLTPHYVTADESYAPDLIASRVYGSETLRWVVTLAAGLEDEADPIAVGTLLKFPPAAWIREQIIHFSDDGNVYGTLKEDT